MEFQVTQIPAIAVLSRRDRLTIPQIPARSGPAIRGLFEMLRENGIAPSRQEIIYIYHDCNGDPGISFDLEICVPIPPGQSLHPPAPMECKSLPEFPCIAFDHIGPMSTIRSSWMRLSQAFRDAHRAPTSQSREVYKKWIALDSPDNVTQLQQGIQV